MFAALFALRAPAQRKTTTSMHPMLSRIWGEQESGAPSADTIPIERFGNEYKDTRPTVIELLESPLACDHRPIFLSLLLLPDLEVDKRTAVWRLSKLHVLPVAVALVDAVNEHVHGDTWGDKVLG